MAYICLQIIYKIAMKNLMYLFLSIFLITTGVSCSSDDDDSGENNPPAETASLTGDWQLTRVDFTNAVPGGFPLEDQCMTTLIIGYQFKENHNLAIVIGANFPSGQDFWTWEGDETAFTITQNNLSMPPYNFGLSAENVEIEKIEGKWQMTFTSTLGHGSKAKFTLVKQDINESLKPTIYNSDGSIYTCDFGN